MRSDDAAIDTSTPTVEVNALHDDDLRPVALALRGRTGADVASVVRRARGNARRNDRPLALGDLVSVARENAGPDRPAEAVRRTCVHEAGHAVACLALGIGEVHSLSIEADGGVTHTRFQPASQTRQEIEHMLAFLLAGRAAEIVVLGDPSAGAGGTPESDLARATRTATLMHTSFGLGGSLVWASSDDGPLALRLMPEVRDEVERTLTAAHERAVEIVTRERAAVERIAERLQADGYVEGNLVIRLCAGDA